MIEMVLLQQRNWLSFQTLNAPHKSFPEVIGLACGRYGVLQSLKASQGMHSSAG